MKGMRFRESVACTLARLLDTITNCSWLAGNAGRSDIPSAVSIDAVDTCAAVAAHPNSHHLLVGLEDGDLLVLSPGEKRVREHATSDEDEERQ